MHHDWTMKGKYIRGSQLETKKFQNDVSYRFTLNLWISFAWILLNRPWFKFADLCYDSWTNIIYNGIFRWRDTSSGTSTAQQKNRTEKLVMQQYLNNLAVIGQNYEKHQKIIVR